MGNRCFDEGQYDRYKLFVRGEMHLLAWPYVICVDRYLGGLIKEEAEILFSHHGKRPIFGWPISYELVVPTHGVRMNGNGIQ